MNIILTKTEATDFISDNFNIRGTLIQQSLIDEQFYTMIDPNNQDELLIEILNKIRNKIYKKVKLNKKIVIKYSDESLSNSDRKELYSGIIATVIKEYSDTRLIEMGVSSFKYDEQLLVKQIITNNVAIINNMATLNKETLKKLSIEVSVKVLTQLLKLRSLISIQPVQNKQQIKINKDLFSTYAVDLSVYSMYTDLTVSENIHIHSGFDKISNNLMNYIIQQQITNLYDIAKYQHQTLNKFNLLDLIYNTNNLTILTTIRGLHELQRQRLIRMVDDYLCNIEPIKFCGQIVSSNGNKCNVYLVQSYNKDSSSDSKEFILGYGLPDMDVGYTCYIHNLAVPHIEIQPVNYHVYVRLTTEMGNTSTIVDRPSEYYKLLTLQ